MEKTVCLVEHAWQVADFRARPEFRGCRWIALGPTAMDALDQGGLPYTTPDEYGAPEALRQECRAQFEQVRVVAERMDREIVATQPEWQEWKTGPFGLQLWQVAKFTDGLRGRVAQLRNILAHFPAPTRFAIHQGPEPNWDWLRMEWRDHDLLWGRLLALPGWNREVTIRNAIPSLPVRTGQTPAATDGAPERLRRFAKGLVRFVRRSLPTVGARHDPVVGILNDAGLWSEVTKVLAAGRIRAVAIPRPASVPPAALRMIRPGQPWATVTLERWEQWVDRWAVGEIDYRPLVKDRICWMMERAGLVAGETRVELMRYGQRQPLAGLLGIAASDFLLQLTKQFYLNRGVPVITFQHGATWFNRQITLRYDLIDLAGSSLLLTYGEAARTAYLASCPGSESRVVAVGSPRLDRLRTEKPLRSRNDPPRRILYLTNNYYQNRWYCGLNPPFSDTRLFSEQDSIQRRLRAWVKTRPRLHMTVKMHPSRFGDALPFGEELKRAGVKVVKNQTAVATLLKRSDVVILDTPTTMMLEAMALGLPIFVLTSVVAPPPAHLALLRRRVVCADSAAELMDRLESFLVSGRYPAELAECDYLKLYGTHHHDGGSARRAADIVAALVRAGGVAAG